MALVKCRDCGTDISTDARACPKCGKRQTSLYTQGCAITGGVLILFFIIAMVADQNRGGGHRADAAPDRTSIQVRTAAGAKPELVDAIEVVDSDAVEAARKQILTAQYSCGTITKLWAIAFTLQQSMKIMRADCDGAQSFQVTLFDGKSFVKPWNGDLMGD